MKRIISALLMIFCGFCFSQNTAKDFFSSDKMVWYGLNFSEAKMVGLFDQGGGVDVSGASEIKNKWIPSWNFLVISEPENFNLGKTFEKSDVYMDLGPTEKQNQSIDANGFVSYNIYHFADPIKTVTSVISKMEEGEKKEGFGVVFIVESFNKIQKTATVYVSVFDIKSKNVLISERLTCVPKGIGLRNFWGGAIKEMIKQIDATYYNAWKWKAEHVAK